MELDLDVVQSVVMAAVDCLGCWSPSLLLLCGWHNPSFNNMNVSLDACYNARDQGGSKLYPSGESLRMLEDQRRYQTRRRLDMWHGMNWIHMPTPAVPARIGE